MSRFAATPAPPYYAVIFSSLRRDDPDARAPNGMDYGAMAARMGELAAQQPGYLGVESVRDADGVGITVSYWRGLEDIAAWKANAEHRIAQETGHAKWYAHFETRIARVERAYSASPHTATNPGAKSI